MTCPVATLKRAVRNVHSATQLPPRPKGHRFLGILPGRRDWIQAFDKVQQECGDVTYCKYVGMPACLLCHPEHIADVLIVNAQNYTKSNMLRMLLGDGLATSEGELWRRQRNLLLPLFSRERLPGYSQIMTRHIDRMMGRWQESGTRELYRDMMLLTLDIAAESFLGVELDDNKRETLLKGLETVLDQFIVQGNQCFLIPRWVPTRSNRRIRSAVKAILTIVDQFIQDRRAELEHGESTRRDLLTTLLQAQRNGARISDELVRDEAVTFLLGGHETTAIALAWTWLSIGQHPEVEQRLAEELKTQLHGRPVSFEDLPRLPYLEKVVKEATRLYPAAWYATRRTDRDVDIGGYRVPKGVTVVMNIWRMHHDPRFYPDPDTFLPERWTVEFTDQLPKFAYLPFGAGARMCIGSTFARTEMMLAVASVVQRFNVSAAPDAVFTRVAATTLRPGEGGIPMVVRSRTAHREMWADDRVAVATSARKTQYCEVAVG